MAQSVTAIAAHTHIKGEVRLEGPGVIAGQVQGNVKTGADLEIAAEGIIDGDIRGTGVTIHGTVKGNILAAQACRIGAKARVAGNICTADLAIQVGARFIGHVCVGETEGSDMPASTEAQGNGVREVGAIRPSDAREEAAALRAVEATITRVEKVTARREEPAPAIATTVSIPTAPALPTVQVLTENVQATLHRAPRIIKAR
jgi:cytoskeletal protein CcmA (bactofilin family)